jgi:hypothetical protein
LSIRIGQPFRLEMGPPEQRQHLRLEALQVLPLDSRIAPDEADQLRVRLLRPHAGAVRGMASDYAAPGIRRPAAPRPDPEFPAIL